MTADERSAVERAALQLRQIAADLARGPSGDEEDVRAYERRVAERLRLISGQLKALVDARTGDDH